MDKTLPMKEIKPNLGHEQYPIGLRSPMTLAEREAKKKVQSQLNVINKKILEYVRYKLNTSNVQKSINPNILSVKDFELDIYDNNTKSINNSYSILGIMGLGIAYELNGLKLSLKRKIANKSLKYKDEALKKFIGGAVSLLDNKLELKKLIGIDIGVTPSDQQLIGVIQDRKNGIAKVLHQTTVDKLDRILSEGIADGSSFDDIVQNVQVGLGMDDVRAELIARTETNWALNEGQRQYAQSLGVSQYMVSLANDACDDCRDETDNGSAVYNIDEQDILPIHPNCRCMMYSVIPDEWLDGLEKSINEKEFELSKIMRDIEQTANFTKSLQQIGIKLEELDKNTPRNDTIALLEKKINEKPTVIKGIDGKSGRDGKDGISIKGEKGRDGKDGYTPVKGKDYFTDTEIQELKKSITPKDTWSENIARLEKAIREMRPESISKDEVTSMISEAVNKLQVIIPKAKWGEIVGTITDQKDLIKYISENGGGGVSDGKVKMNAGDTADYLDTKIDNITIINDLGVLKANTGGAVTPPVVLDTTRAYDTHSPTGTFEVTATSEGVGFDGYNNYNDLGGFLRVKVYPYYVEEGVTYITQFGTNVFGLNYDSPEGATAAIWHSITYNWTAYTGRHDGYIMFFNWAEYSATNPYPDYAFTDWDKYITLGDVTTYTADGTETLAWISGVPTDFTQTTYTSVVPLTTIVPTGSALDAQIIKDKSGRTLFEVLGTGEVGLGAGATAGIGAVIDSGSANYVQIQSKYGMDTPTLRIVNGYNTAGVSLLASGGEMFLQNFSENGIQGQWKMTADGLSIFTSRNGQIAEYYSSYFSNAPINLIFRVKQDGEIRLDTPNDVGTLTNGSDWVFGRYDEVQGITRGASTIWQDIYNYGATDILCSFSGTYTGTTTGYYSIKITTTDTTPYGSYFQWSKDGGAYNGVDIAVSGSPTLLAEGVYITFDMGSTVPFYVDQYASVKVYAQTADLYQYQKYDGTPLVRVKKDGQVRLEDTAVAYDDLRIEPSVKGTGAKNPSFVNWKNGLYLYDFDNAVLASEKEIFFTVQLPHSWKVGTTIHPHCHWVNKTAGSAGDKIYWGLEYTKAKIGSAFGASTTIYGDTIVGNGNITVVDSHMITELPDIDMTGDEVSTILVCRLFRHSSHANDTYTHTAGLLYVDFHIEVDSFGGDTEFTKS